MEKFCDVGFVTRSGDEGNNDDYWNDVIDCLF